MSWKYILFDLDGTLTDSSEGILNCVRYALESYGYEIPKEEKLIEFIGPPLTTGFQQILGMEEEEAVKLTAKFRERYAVDGLFENKPYEGIKEELAQLKAAGKVLAVATSKPEKFAVRILEKFELAQYFDVIAGSLLDGTRESKSLVIEEVFRKLKLSEEDKKDIIMVGDRRQDVEGAKKCGISSLGVYYGFAFSGEHEEAGADYIIDMVPELTNILLP